MKKILLRHLHTIFIISFYLFILTFIAAVFLLGVYVMFEYTKELSVFIGLSLCIGIYVGIYRVTK